MQKKLRAFAHDEKNQEEPHKQYKKRFRIYPAFLYSQLDKWLKRAKEHVKKCIFDPVCINKEKACAGCLFLNEVSCRHFNKDLDRSYLCGYFDNQKQKKLEGYWEI